MAHLIDKDALVAWAKETYLCENASMIRRVCYKQLLEHLDTLEVKEVNSNGAFIDSMNSGMDYDKLDIMLDDALAKETKESWNKRLGKEEPISDDMEKAAEKYAYELFPSIGAANTETELAFKAGAQWRREQMEKNVVLETKVYLESDGDGIESEHQEWLALENNEILDIPNNIGLKDGDKVKVIIIKDESV